MRTLQCSLIAGALLLACAPASRGDTGDGAEGASRVAVGQPAPPVALPAADGTVYDSTQVADAKGLVLVFFRGAW